MKSFLTLVFPLVALMLSNSASATLTIHRADHRVSLVRDMDEILVSVRALVRADPLSSYAEIVEIEEVPDTFIAIFSHTRVMNASLDRASDYIEEKKMQTHQQLVHGFRSRAVAGHDLLGPDLIRYWEAFEKARTAFAPLATGGEYLQIETEFWENFLLPKLKTIPNLVLLGFSIDRGIEIPLAHEILHAQYFQTPKFQQVVQRFWETQVAEADKKLVRQILSPYYDSGNEGLMRNEFQAYLLQTDSKHSEFGLLGLFSDKYRLPLKQALKDAGIEPIEFHLKNGVSPKSALLPDILAQTNAPN